MSASIQIMGREAPVMEFLCKVCGKREGEPRGWHIVIELDKPGTHIRNTIFILDKWDEKRACETNAACFCSSKCQEGYLAARHRQLVA